MGCCPAGCDHAAPLDCPALPPAPTIDDRSTPNLRAQQNNYCVYRLRSLQHVLYSISRNKSGWERMGTPFPGPPFLQSGVPRPQRALFFRGNARSQARKIVLSMRKQGPEQKCFDILLLSLNCWQECKGYYCCSNFLMNWSI